MIGVVQKRKIKEEKVKKHLLLVILFLLAVPFIFMAGNSSAKGRYGSDVNDFCLDSDPYVGDCLLCHTANSKADPHPGRDAIIDDDLCYFCQSDSACGGGPVDNDNDGYDNSTDCDDNDAAINPGATEDCTDGIDNDCDNLVDAQDPDAQNCPLTCTDDDADTYSIEGGDCGAVDCNDSDFTVNPGVVEDCADGVDNDCDNKDDCADSDCVGDPACQSSGTCSDYNDKTSCNADSSCSWGGGKNKSCQDAGGTEPPSNCSDYDGTDAATCSAADCRWNKKKLTCN